MRVRSLVLVRLRKAAVVVVSAALLPWTAPAWAAECPTLLTGVESAPWRAAVEDLAQVNFRDTDCARIVVDVGLEETRLSFVTADGREAVRTLSTPAELRPTVEALLVAGSLATETAPAGAARVSPKQVPPRAASPEADRVPERFVGTTPKTGAAYALQTGARVGSQIGGGKSDAILLSPVLVGSAWMGRYPWELGVLASIEFQYFDLRNHDPAERENSSVAVGVAIGRRDALDTVALLTSLRLSVATIEAENEKGSGEARAGVGIGLSYPNQRFVRLRGDLCAELVAGSNLTSPESPEWAVSTLLGVEFGGG